MDDRIIEFVRGMRAAGVRVSMAESADAMRAIEVLGITDKELFRQSLRTTLVKESEDFTVFEELFPLYFSAGGPPMQNALEDLSEDEQEMLKAGDVNKDYSLNTAIVKSFHRMFMNSTKT